MKTKTYKLESNPSWRDIWAFEGEVFGLCKDALLELQGIPLDSETIWMTLHEKRPSNRNAVQLSRYGAGFVMVDWTRIAIYWVLETRLNDFGLPCWATFEYEA